MSDLASSTTASTEYGGKMMVVADWLPLLAPTECHVTIPVPVKNKQLGLR